ncbi:MAG: OST-HTH/LOTUS domain-containing protein, partial [Bacilli bacterium]
TNDNDIAHISKVGANIRKIDPSFDARTYGFTSLSKLFDNLTDFEIIKNEVGELNHPLVKRK